MLDARYLILLLLFVSPAVWAQDTTAPSVKITSLTDQDYVGGKIDVTADASDDVGVTEVKFFKDGTLIEADTTSPFSARFDFNADATDQAYVPLDRWCLENATV